MNIKGSGGEGQRWQWVGFGRWDGVFVEEMAGSSD